MPNHCDTKYVFVGSETEIADLHKKIKLISYDSSMERNLESLGRICGVNCEGIDCDGDIGCYELETPTKLELEVITGHRERNAVFVLILKNYPSIQCYFSVECNDSDYYVTNDYGRQHFPERYIIKQGGEEPEYCNNLPAFFKSISERLLTNTDSMDKVIDRVHKWNKSHDYENQIRVNEIQLVDDLCNIKVKFLVSKMESVVRDNAKIIYSHSFYRDIDFVARTLGEKGFVWVLLPEETGLYQNDSLSDMQLLLQVMDDYSRDETPYQIYHHRSEYPIYQRQPNIIREWAKERIKELTEPTNAKS